MSENPTLDTVTIGYRLQLVRKLTGLTQDSFAKKHNFKRSRYNHWETGLRRIPLEIAHDLCTTYSLTLDYIYRGVESGLPRMLAEELLDCKKQTDG